MSVSENQLTELTAEMTKGLWGFGHLPVQLYSQVRTRDVPDIQITWKRQQGEYFCYFKFTIY